MKVFMRLTLPFFALLQVFPGFNNRCHAFFCILLIIQPRHHNLISNILVNPSIMFYHSHRYMKNKITDEFKILNMAQFFCNWSRIF